MKVKNSIFAILAIVSSNALCSNSANADIPEYLRTRQGYAEVESKCFTESKDRNYGSFNENYFESCVMDKARNLPADKSYTPSEEDVRRISEDADRGVEKLKNCRPFLDANNYDLFNQCMKN